MSAKLYSVLVFETELELERAREIESTICYSDAHCL